MNKKNLSLISLILALVMILSALVSCTTGNGTQETSSEATSEERETNSDTESGNGDDTDNNGTESETDDIGDDTETGSEDDTSPKLEGNNAELIEYADRISNSVSVSYSDSKKTDMILQNSNMSLEYELSGSEPQLVSALKNSKGSSYFENSMDVFVRMKSGNTYYSSQTLTDTATNIYRLGYYYYDVRLENQDFAPAPNVISEMVLPFQFKSHKHLTNPKVKGDELFVAVKGGNDPYMVFKHDEFSADKYTYFQVTMKVESDKAETVDIYYMSDESSTYYDYNKVTLSLIPDGEYHTYTICLDTARAYTGTIKNLRIDFSGEEGTLYTFKSFKMLEADTSDLPDLKLGRFFQVYSDKLHHYAQFCATSSVTDIDAVGVLTEIKADTVSAIVIKDANGLHNSLEEADFNTAVYVGFDIKDTGILGYILPTGQYGGKLEVTYSNGIYSIIQTLAPENNTINPSVQGTNNANDFYIGQRIYTDESHDFAAFINEAEAERKPLTIENVRINGRKSTGASFLGYDALRGSYRLSVNGVGFGTAFYQSPNKHYNATFTVTGDEYDRKMYFSTYTTSGGLECAVLLDDKMMLLPVPVEVCKNFLGDGENNLYNMDEPSYGEAYVPIIVKANEEKGYTIVNLYQNWGKYPLKQLSSIQYFYPYYHLSTGVTESNCIVPYAFVGPYLPDHRAMSAPLWADQPQHTLGGHHRFLGYTDSEGNYSASQHLSDNVLSHGPTYAEVEMDYLSDDGKIKVTYTHMEMPQTDENRTYYVMEYKVLEDISFNDFKNDFQFYSVRQTGTGSTYKKVGYLNENNESVIVDAMPDGEEASYVLGNYYPYFDFFYVPDYTNENGYVNLSFIIADSSFTIGGEESDAPFIVTNKNETLYLSLNLDKVTLKKGDSFTIHAILTPWGSQESVYDGSNGKAPDQNVRDIRENSVIDPLKIEAVSDCEVMDSVFLPRIRTTHGKMATFTLSGGENNVVVRAYGFDVLTVPIIQEKIDGKWEDFEVSSINSPDSLGNANHYDGYMVHYDGDGTFSYSFVVTMTGDEERTFRVVASRAFNEWPEEEVQEEITPIDVYCGPTKLDIKLEGAKGVGRTEFLTENDKSFVRIYGNNKDTEGNTTVYVADEKKESGSYVIIKYRIPMTNPEPAGTFEMFASTLNSGAKDGDQFYCYNVKKDGFWHVIVIDLSKEKHPTFSADADGLYYANYLRFDFFGQKMSEESYIDVEYVGMSNDLQGIFELNSDMNTVTLITGGSKETHYDVKTGEIVDKSGDGELPEVELPEDTEDESTPINVYSDAAKLESKLNGAKGVGNKTLLTENGKSFVRIYGNNTDTEGNTVVYSATTKKQTGSFVVIKYRIPTTNSEKIGCFEIFTSTENTKATGGDQIFYYNLKHDGFWHVIVIDVSKENHPTFSANDEGKYYAKYLRFDFFSSKMSEQSYIDIEYVGMSTDMESILALNSDMNTVTLITNGSKETFYDVKTGEEVEESGDGKLPKVEYVSPESDYTESTVQFASCIDMINGWGIGENKKLTNIGANSLRAPDVLDYGVNTVNDHQLIFTGWAVVDGGADRYVWSVDGGKTWIDATLTSGLPKIGNASVDHLKSASAKLGGYVFSDEAASSANCTFQGTIGAGASVNGLYADLTEYAGQSVDITFAVVPKTAPDTLCIILHVKNVQVSE